LERDPDLFYSRLDTIRRQGEEMKAALEAYDLETVGKIMLPAHLCNVLVYDSEIEY